MRMSTVAFLCGCGLIVSACAKVSVIPLDTNGNATFKAEGMRYYMPRPYLLVMRLPATSSQSGVTSETTRPNMGGRTSPPSIIGPPPPGSIPPGGPSPNKTDNGQPSGGPSSGGQTPITDTSYQAVSDQYVAKLIYLPDMSQPMAVTESPGLFGTVSMGASLQDGWMLTSLQGSGDTKTAETIGAIASLVSSLQGGAAKPAAAAKAPGALTPEEVNVLQPQLLSAGLYDFMYRDGTLAGMCRLASFEQTPNPPLTVLPFCYQVSPAAAGSH
jgi:hypothetical protein